MGTLVRLHNLVFGSLERLLAGWFLGLAGRAVFAAVLLVFFLASFLDKLGGGIFGLINLSHGAYQQILPRTMAAADAGAGSVTILDHVIVYVATYAELVLPILIVLGLFTRLASLGMVIFVVVMSWTEIADGAFTATVGTWFDAAPDAPIADQRLLWLFLLIYLVVRGPGLVSLDYLLGRRRGHLL